MTPFSTLQSFYSDLPTGVLDQVVQKNTYGEIQDYIPAIKALKDAQRRLRAEILERNDGMIMAAPTALNSADKSYLGGAPDALQFFCTLPEEFKSGRRIAVFERLCSAMTEYIREKQPTHYQTFDIIYHKGHSSGNTLAKECLAADSVATIAILRKSVPEWIAATRHPEFMHTIFKLFLPTYPRLEAIEKYRDDAQKLYLYQNDLAEGIYTKETISAWRKRYFPHLRDGHLSQGDTWEQLTGAFHTYSGIFQNLATLGLMPEDALEATEFKAEMAALWETMVNRAVVLKGDLAVTRQTVDDYLYLSASYSPQGVAFRYFSKRDPDQVKSSIRTVAHDIGGKKLRKLRGISNQEELVSWRVIRDMIFGGQSGDDYHAFIYDCREIVNFRNMRYDKLLDFGAWVDARHPEDLKFMQFIYEPLLAISDNGTNDVKAAYAPYRAAVLDFIRGRYRAHLAHARISREPGTEGAALVAFAGEFTSGEWHQLGFHQDITAEILSWLPKDPREKLVAVNAFVTGMRMGERPGDLQKKQKKLMTRVGEMAIQLLSEDDFSRQIPLSLRAETFVTLMPTLEANPVFDAAFKKFWHDSAHMPEARRGLIDPALVGWLYYDDNKFKLALDQLQSRHGFQRDTGAIPAHDEVDPRITALRDDIDAQFPEKSAVEAMGVFGIKAGQFLAASGLAPPELREELRDFFDHAAPPLRTEIFRKLGEIFGTGLVPIVTVGRLLGSGSVNFVVEVFLSHPRTGVPVRAVLRIQRDSAAGQIRNENIIWQKTLRRLSSSTDSNIRKFVSVMEEVRAQKMATLGPTGMELDQRREIKAHPRAERAYQRAKSWRRRFAVDVTQPLGEFNAIIPAALISDPHEWVFHKG